MTRTCPSGITELEYEEYDAWDLENLARKAKGIRPLEYDEFLAMVSAIERAGCTPIWKRRVALRPRPYFWLEQAMAKKVEDLVPYFEKQIGAKPWSEAVSLTAQYAEDKGYCWSSLFNALEAAGYPQVDLVFSLTGPVKASWLFPAGCQYFR